MNKMVYTYACVCLAFTIVTILKPPYHTTYVNLEAKVACFYACTTNELTHT